MKILFITSRLPFPPYRGDKLRTYNFIRVLAQFHEIHLISFCESRKDYVSQVELKKYCKEIHLVYLPKWLSWAKALFFYFSSEPSQAVYYRSFRMKRLITRIAKKEKFALAYTHLFRMYRYQRFLPKNVYKVTDLTDVISKEMFRSVAEESELRVRVINREATKIRNYERKVTRFAQEVWVISEQEKADLLVSSAREGNVFVVCNGVNEKKGGMGVSKNNAILFFGYSSTNHNKTALKFLREKIMPEIKKEIPDVKLNVFGAGKWENKKNGKDEFPVNNFGFVADTDEVFSSSAVMVAPILYSAGTQNKILEAMNFGMPVVTSDFGNEGIQATNGLQIVLCGNAAEYVREIVHILKDRTYNEWIGTNGQKYVRDKFSWNNVSDRVTMIEKTLKSQNLKP